MKRPSPRPVAAPRTYRSHQPDRSNLAIIALVLGIIALIAWLIPAVGLFIALIGLVLAYLSRNSAQERLAQVGLVLNSLGLLAALTNAILGSYFGLTGFF